MRTIGFGLAVALATLAGAAAAGEDGAWRVDERAMPYAGGVRCVASYDDHRVERYAIAVTTPVEGIAVENILTISIPDGYYFQFARPTAPGNADAQNIRESKFDLGFGLDFATHMPTLIQMPAGDERIDWFRTADPLARAPMVADRVVLATRVTQSFLAALAEKGYIGTVFLGREDYSDWAMPTDLGDMKTALAKLARCTGQ